MTIDEMIEKLNEMKAQIGGDAEVRFGLKSYRCAPAVDFCSDDDNHRVVEGVAWFAVQTAHDYCPDLWSDPSDFPYDDDAPADSYYDQEDSDEGEEDEGDAKEADLSALANDPNALTVGNRKFESEEAMNDYLFSDDDDKVWRMPDAYDDRR